MVARTSGLFVVFLVTVTFIFVSSFQFGSIGNLHHHSRRHFVALCVVKDGNELNELTVVELKARLKAKGLIVSGLKKDLIERLASSSNEETSSNVSSVDNAKEQKVPVAVPKKVSKNNVPVSKVSTKAEPKQQPKHEPDNEDDFLSQLMAEGDEILQEDRHQSSASGSVRSNSVKSSTSSSSSSSSSSRRSSGSVSSSGSVNVEEIQRLCDQRNELRYHRDYDGADAVRDQLENDFGLKIFDFKNEWVARDGTTGPLNSQRQVSKYPAAMYEGSLEMPVTPANAVPTSLSKKEIEELVYRRTVERRARNWAEADAIRDELAEKGVELFDKANEWRTFDGEMRGIQSQDFDSYNVQKDRERFPEQYERRGGGGGGRGRGGGGRW